MRPEDVLSQNRALAQHASRLNPGHGMNVDPRVVASLWQALDDVMRERDELRKKAQTLPRDLKYRRYLGGHQKPKKPKPPKPPKEGK